MKILVTGSNGFIGKNLIVELKSRKYTEIFQFDKDTDYSLLDDYCAQADFIFHLAGVNRPENPSEFMEGNFGFTSDLLSLLKKHSNPCPIMISSSIQAALENPYGLSKRAGEDLLFEYSKESGANVLVYRFPNVFGKWSRPNYNSAIATFCYKISRDEEIDVNDKNAVLRLVYIDDVVNELISALTGKENCIGNYCEVPITHTVSLGKIVELLYSFRKSRISREIPDLSDAFTKKLYSTYLSFLPINNLSYPLKMNIDQRGSFTEFIKSPDRGQVSVNISKPGITKGNHWHHTKNEKFLVVSGIGIVRFRSLDSDEVTEYHVSGEMLEVIDIPPGFTHNIENLGDKDMVTIMWANEPFDPEHPDTYFLEV